MPEDARAAARVWPYLDHPRPLAIAHRGGGDGTRAENSMAAFEASRALGYRYVETDAHATRDGVLVAFHDDALDRLTDARGAIADLDWADVARARIAGREPIPRLEEVLTTWPDLRVNIDPKSDRAAALLPDLVRRTGALERICVGSFSDRRIASLRAALGPDLCTSMGPWAVAALFFSRFGWPMGAPRAGCIQIPEAWNGIRLAAPGVVERAHELGLQVHVWTVNDVEAMERLIDIGVDGLITDRLELLREVLTRRGLWAGGTPSAP
jgi:glycerophosphoryl diester phosphodiesterase